MSSKSYRKCTKVTMFLGRNDPNINDSFKINNGCRLHFFTLHKVYTTVCGNTGWTENITAPRRQNSEA